MIGTTKPQWLTFSPALPCMSCQQLTNRGLLAPMGSLAWQLFPRCDAHFDQPVDAEEPVALGTLRRRIDEQLQVIQQLQRRRQHLARAYLRLRRQRAHSKAQRALRIGLNRTYRRQAQVIEEVIA